MGLQTQVVFYQSQIYYFGSIWNVYTVNWLPISLLGGHTKYYEIYWNFELFYHGQEKNYVFQNHYSLNKFKSYILIWEVNSFVISVWISGTLNPTISNHLSIRTTDIIGIFNCHLFYCHVVTKSWKLESPANNCLTPSQWELSHLPGFEPGQ